MGIYKRKILRRKKENPFNQEKSKIEEKKKEYTLSTKKERSKKKRKHAFDQESKIQEKND